MDAIVRESLRLLNAAFGYPGDLTKLVVLVILAALIFLLSMRKMGEVLRIPEPDKGAIGIFLVSMCLMLLIGSVYRIYLADKISDPQLRRYMPLLLAIVVLLLVTLPSICLIQRATVVSGFISLLSSLLVTALLILLASALINALWAGKEGLDKSRKRSETFSDFFLD